MITTLKIRLKSENGLNQNMSSLLHGYMVENVNAEFAEKIHISELRTYSQYLKKCNDEWFWVINSLDDYTKENLIDKLTNSDEIYLKNKDIRLEILSYEISRTSFDKLFESNYYSDNNLSRFINFQFTSPTAFKSGGQYINYPDIRMLFSSVIKKYDNASENTSIYDENMFNSLLESVRITDYNLRSCYFHLEGVKIPSFMGRVTIKVNGSKNMVSLVHMLTDFAEYSGIGIKCAIGMGAVSKNNKTR